MILTQLLGENAIGIGALQELNAKTNIAQELQSALSGNLKKKTAKVKGSQKGERERECRNAPSSHR